MLLNFPFYTPHVLILWQLQLRKRSPSLVDSCLPLLPRLVSTTPLSTSPQPIIATDIFIPRFLQAHPHPVARAPPQISPSLSDLFLTSLPVSSTATTLRLSSSSTTTSLSLPHSSSTANTPALSCSHTPTQQLLSGCSQPAMHSSRSSSTAPTIFWCEVSISISLSTAAPVTSPPSSATPGPA